MKNQVAKKSLFGALACMATMLFSVNSALASTTWDFNGAPTDGGWTYDLSSRALGNNRFPIQFVSSRVSCSGGKLICTSGDLIDGTTPVEGGGIVKSDGFSTNDISAKCNMAGSATINKRSQASFWLSPSGPNSHEVDMFEYRPTGKCVLNFISWVNGQINQAENDSVIDWGGTATTSYTWRLTRTGDQFTVTKDGGSAHSYTILSGRTIGTEIIIHNKPWRFPSSLTEGPVGTLKCDWVTKG